MAASAGENVTQVWKDWSGAEEVFKPSVHSSEAAFSSGLS